MALCKSRRGTPNVTPEGPKPGVFKSLFHVATSTPSQRNIATSSKRNQATICIKIDTWRIPYFPISGTGHPSVLTTGATVPEVPPPSLHIPPSTPERIGLGLDARKLLKSESAWTLSFVPGSTVSDADPDLHSVSHSL
jgi:hypothetical protein